MILKYGIKDIKTNEYFTNSGRGYHFANCEYGFSEDIDNITLYSSKSPAKTFINQYNYQLEANISRQTLTEYARDLVVIEIEVEYREI